MYDHYDALIFDMDGTLVDSGQLHQRAWELMLEKYKFPIDPPYMRSLAGVPTNRTIEMLIEKFNIKAEASIAEMTLYKERYAYENFHKYLKPTALIDIVKKYHGQKPMALGTGAITEDAKQVLQICGLTNYISVVVGADQVKHPKPAPDTFLRCAELLNVNPKNCVVFEDAKLGLQAAKSAGMTGIDVLEIHNIVNDYFL
jgi:beta-phosphoglucomutase family hydrolase